MDRSVYQKLKILKYYSELSAQKRYILFSALKDYNRQLCLFLP